MRTSKSNWWYLDALPSHAWLRWRYHYPQAAFPYQQLIDENARRSRDDAEYERLDTGVFDDDRCWVVDVCYAKASPTEVLARITVQNRGPEEASLSLLPTVWFRNVWRISDQEPPALSLDANGIVADRGRLSGYRLDASTTSDGIRPTRCSVTTRPTRNGSSALLRSPPIRRMGSTITSSPARPR